MSDEVGRVGGAPEPVLNSGIQTMQMEEHAQLIESKSQMLDEVNQLVDLMSAEKSSLLQRIASLETQLQEKSSEEEGKVEELRQAQSKVVTREGEILELETSR